MISMFFRMLYRVFRYSYNNHETVSLTIRSDHRWNNEIHRNFMIAIINLVKGSLTEP